MTKVVKRKNPYAPGGSFKRRIVEGMANIDYQSLKRGLALGKKLAWSLGNQEQNNSNMDSAVRFINLGDRANATSKKYRRKKKVPYRRRRRIRIFRKKIKRALAVKKPISFLTERTSSAMTITAATGGLAVAPLSAGNQLILGDDHWWGVNLGDAWYSVTANVRESTYINRELFDYQVRVNGVDVSLTDVDRIEQGQHYVKRRYNKLSIHNTNPNGKDLIMDIYECTAARTISDPQYRSPWAAWRSLQFQYGSTTTGNAPVPQSKGLEPTDFADFGKYWHIDKKHSLRIPAGGTDSLNSYQTFKIHGKKYLHAGYKANTMFAMKGVTRMMMIVIDPERMATRYSGAEAVCDFYHHRNTHFYPTNIGQHASINVNQLTETWPTATA